MFRLEDGTRIIHGSSVALGLTIRLCLKKTEGTDPKTHS